MGDSLPIIRAIDEKFKSIVWGFIHQYEQKTVKIQPPNGVWIPLLIKHFCLKYYLIQDFFVKLTKSNPLISRKKMNVGYKTKLLCGNIIDYNDESISIYKWKFRLSSWTSDSIGIGVQSTSPEKLKVKPQPKFHELFIFPKIDAYHYIVKDIGREHRFISYIRFKINRRENIPDVITMAMDVRNKKLGYAVNTASNDWTVEWVKDWNKDEEVDDKWWKEHAFQIYLMLGAAQTEVEMIGFDIEQHCTY